MVKKDSIAIFPILSTLPVVHGFSWGQDAENMSEKYSSDPNLIELRVSDFLIELGANQTSIVVTINPNENPYNDPDVMEVTNELLQRHLTEAGEINVAANSIFTHLSNTILTVKPADCAICILYFENNLKEKFVGLIHCSARETNKLLPEQTIKYLKENYMVDPKSIKVGITPAISKEYFSVKEDKINENNWGGFMEKKDGLIYIDIIGNVMNQFSKSGLLSENIQFYGIDTFTSALEGKTFSHRLARDLNLPEGRYIVAVGLK